MITPGGFQVPSRMALTEINRSASSKRRNRAEADESGEPVEKAFKKIATKRKSSPSHPPRGQWAVGLETGFWGCEASAMCCSISSIGRIPPAIM
jgi:hypothetical protein